MSIDHSRFIALLKERFPEVASEITDCSKGLLHPEMVTLSDATQAAIDAHDESTVKRHFEFVDEVFGDAAPDVMNAVIVSYLENLRFGRTKAGLANASELLTPRLHHELVELEAYLAKIHGGDGQA